MKQNITFALDKPLLKKARALAAKQGSSVSAILAQELFWRRNSQELPSARMAIARQRTDLWLGSVHRSRWAARKVLTGKVCMTGKHFVDSNILIYRMMRTPLSASAGLRRSWGAFGTLAWES